MSGSTETAHASPQTLQPTDAEFAMIAARAALELDQLVLGRSTSLTHVSRIADLLSVSTSIKEGMQYPAVNAALFAVIGEAFNMTSAVPLQSSDKIIAAASEIAGKLVPDTVRPAKEHIENMRAFCVALSQAAL